MRAFFGPIVATIVIGFCTVDQTFAEPTVTLEQKSDRLGIAVDGNPLAEYVWQDAEILRPYFTHLHAPGGAQVTRNHPPREGHDPADHATMHPGLWLAFGDISGGDFWRNKGTVKHVKFTQEPKAQENEASFAALNRYSLDDKPICDEACRIKITAGPDRYAIFWESRFTGGEEFYFGDQEEMGLGVRMATPLSVKQGGQIVNSDGLKNEKLVWGKEAVWCDYSGTIDGQSVGIMLMPDPSNFRRSRFHARDYGLLVANAFGINAFTHGPKSKVAVPVGMPLRLSFGVLIHTGQIDLAAAYRDWLTQIRRMD